ncbi:peptide deformylase [Candidatus Shapirobacteria bacterium CG07_land_8_20_14_0_80_39_18]|uniref:Peptide deformylase n=1 Tax=Candidatus Shapirobacteria bacterium CG07_land_8_20_14_0_80_39_18 TaxID=1974882 RepID=A0A2M6YRY6_9BACT|nr:MAG: peptide deformylase [Candidatus Shapirobacteria bacterium CG07_land_8_20_14_0_80_39_18]
MATRDTLQIGDLRLKAPNKTVEKFTDSSVKQVIQDLIDTMRANELIGMAAPQIGENWKIFVTEPRETKFRMADQVDILRVYINPIILNSSKEESIIYEGCGSVLNGQLFGPVKRPKEITIEAFDQEGKKFRLTCDGILARVIQHEYDHLNGIEFTEKIFDYRKLVSVDFYLKDIKKSPEQIKDSMITKKTTAL